MALGQDLIPKPAQTEFQDGTFFIQSQTGVIAGAELKNESDFVRAELKKYTGVTHKAISPALARRLRFRGGITLSLDPELPENQHKLVVNPKNVLITGHDAEAVFHGIQSFFQIVPAEKVDGLLSVPSLTLTDSPTTPVREVKLDLASHLFPTADLKKFIDLLAFHKLNRLSLTFSNDQGWRIESKKFPKLTEVGSLRPSTPPYGDRHGSNGEEYGGYYTQENLRSLVAHAKSRHVELIPVISFPGQASALLAAYPEWGNDDLKDYAPAVRSNWTKSTHLLAPKEETFAAIKDLLEELFTLLDIPVIGIQDDLSSLEEWEQSPRAQAYIQKKKLNGASGLQADFLSFLTKTAKNLGREIRFESKAPKALRLDHYQRTAALELADDPALEAVGGLFTLREVYHTNSPAAVLHTPFMHEWKKVEYMAFPRLAAFAETRWTAKPNRSYASFLKRLEKLTGHYTRRKVNAARPFEAPRREALHGTIVTTNLGHYLNHWPEGLFDGKKETFFWSNRALEKGDYITLKFPVPISGDVEVATDGPAAEESGGAALANGVLEVSPDGNTWDTVAEFFDGLATVTIPKGTRGLRIRVTGKQVEPLIIHEIFLSQPLTPTAFTETRSVVIGTNPQGEEVVREITFAADFSTHPEFRKKVALLRSRYFSLWPRITTFLGNAALADTPLEYHLPVDAQKMAGESLAETEARFIADLVRHLQTYKAGAPAWFTTGIQAMIRNKEVSSAAPGKTPRKADAVTGGSASGAFLAWVGQKYGEFALTEISKSCLLGYEPRRWELVTGMPLEKLVDQYQR